MEEEERNRALASLNALKDRGRLRITPDNADLIAKAMSPLPPPWEWSALREQIGFTSVDMEARTGFDCGRIRYWESGRGTMYADLWLDYATRLVAVVEEVLREREQASLLRDSQRVLLSPQVAGHLRDLRSVQLAMTTWTSQVNPCTPEEAEQFGASMREVMTALRVAQRRLQRVAARKEQEP